MNLWQWQISVLLQDSVGNEMYLPDVQFGTVFIHLVTYIYDKEFHDFNHKINNNHYLFHN